MARSPDLGPTPGSDAVLHWGGSVARVMVRSFDFNQSYPVNTLEGDSYEVAGIAEYTLVAHRLITSVDDYDRDRHWDDASKLAHAVLAKHDDAALALADEVQMRHNAPANFVSRAELAARIRELEERNADLEREIIAVRKLHPPRDDYFDSEEVW